MALVLLVEDDDDLRFTTTVMIRDLGHEVLATGSAEAAMPLLQAKPIDILVADMALPGSSGEVFAAEARGLRPQLEIVFATGSAELHDHLPDGSGPILLRKPFDIDALEIALGRQ